METKFLLKFHVPAERGKLRRLKGHEGVVIDVNKIIDEFRDSVCGIFVIDRLQRSVMRRIFYARKRVVDSLKHSENSFAVAKKLLNTKLHYFPQSFPLEEGN